MSSGPSEVAVDAVAIALTVPLPSGGARVRVAHHLFDAAEPVSRSASTSVVSPSACSTTGTVG